MIDYSNFKFDLSCGNVIEQYIVESMPQIKDGRAVYLDDVEKNKTYGDISCYNNIIIDVKCKNKDTPNIFTPNPGVEIIDGDRLGWWVNPKKQATHYMFCNYWGEKKLKDMRKTSEIKLLHIMIFSKKELKTWLLQHGITDKMLIDDVQKLQPYYGENKKQYRDQDGKWIGTTTYSYWLPEQPRNYTPPLETYLDLPHTRCYWLSRGKYKKCTKEETLKLVNK